MVRERLTRQALTHLARMRQPVPSSSQCNIGHGGPIAEVRVSVPNRPGIVAQLALAVGDAGVNIVDMALYPASDMQSGAIALWVSGDRGAARALELVESLGYPVAVVADGGEG